MNTGCNLGLVNQGQKLIKGDLSFYIEYYLRYSLLIYVLNLTCALHQPQGLCQSNAPLLPMIDLVELFQKTLHLQLYTGLLLSRRH